MASTICLWGCIMCSYTLIKYLETMNTSKSNFNVRSIVKTYENKRTK